MKEVTAAPDRAAYTDLAIARQENEVALDLYHATRGGEAALARAQREDARRNRLQAKTAAE